MKRLAFVLGSLLIIPAFSEVMPTYYADEFDTSDVDVVESDDDMDLGVKSASAANPGVRNTVRATSSRAMTGSGVRTGSATGMTNSGRNLTTRASGVNAATTARSAATRATVTRSGVTGNVANRGVSATRTVPSNVTSARNTPSKTVARASVSQTDTVNKPLYIGRVGTSGSVSARVPAVRMAGNSVSTTVSTSESKADTVASMDELAQMTDYCKAQYTQCMDNFCNVLDDNQGRCSCSTSLKNYAKTEAALKEATESLQNVAQQIQYIGLSKDEVETLFNQTEAELSLARNSDNSALKNDLDKIKNMIVDVKSGTASVTTDTDVQINLTGLLDFNISSTGFDLGSLFGTTTANTSSISNQRGEQLYKTAAARCKAAVLNSCASQGVDVSVLTNSYDLEIDKQCMAYERALTDANDQMSATVRNAKSVLQKARLMVAQQKNTYDLRGCVNALDTCMQDEFVCGSNYENCLDPTGKYIVNGEIVVGSQPGVSGGNLTTDVANGTGLYSVWNYDSKNAFGTGSVSEYINSGLNKNTNDFNAATAASNMAKFLQQKIGYVNSDGKSLGMCVSVLNKCQNYTYTGNSNNNAYSPNNEVVRNYLERVSMQIKAAQDEKLASYAENCISDVSTCLSQNSYNSLTNQSVSDSISAIAIAACKPIITTCMSVTGYGSVDSNMKNWLQNTLKITVDVQYASLKDIKTSRDCTAVNGTWNSGLCTCGDNAEFVNSTCQCKAGFVNMAVDDVVCMPPLIHVEG